MTRLDATTYARAVSGRRSWILLLLAFLISSALMALPSTGSETAPDALPGDAESARVATVLRQFPDGALAPALAVLTRVDGGAISRTDVHAATAARTRMLDVDRGPATQNATASQQAGPPVLTSPDGRAAVVTVPIDADLSGFPLTEAVQRVRQAGAQGLPSELRLEVTGGPAFGADIANAFSGADTRLLAVTAGVVALLLLLTYRSPILWLVPLIVVGLADRTAQIVAGLVASAVGLPLDGSTTGITSVLVFGAGTNYALLLVSRYREELRREAGHRGAMARAVTAAAPAILASNITVVLALATLLAAALPSTRVLGLAAATGLLVALAFALVVLPPALALCGRGLFWPFVPRIGDTDPSATGGWHRLATLVSARPVFTLLATVPLLLVLGAGLTGVTVGLDQTSQFRVEAQSIDGLRTLRAHLPAGDAGPATVVCRTPLAAQVKEAVERAPGVVRVTPGGVDPIGGRTRLRVVLDGEPGSDAALEAVAAVRTAAHAVDRGDALVGGPDAQQLDERDAAARDRLLILPLILAVVLIVLFVLLKALWAPLLLITATTVSAFAALGAGAWVSTHLLGYPALDTSVPLFAFLFLIALGVDYTIFLVTRAREETPEHGNREGIVRAVALTGGVITSAGIVLAAVFAVLGVLPLVTLTQLGIVVGLGILLDTFVVRTVVIPALFTLVGRQVWWPSELARAAK